MANTVHPEYIHKLKRYDLSLFQPIGEKSEKWFRYAEWGSKSRTSPTRRATASRSGSGWTPATTAKIHAVCAGAEQEVQQDFAMARVFARSAARARRARRRTAATHGSLQREAVVLTQSRNARTISLTSFVVNTTLRTKTSMVSSSGQKSFGENKEKQSGTEVVSSAPRR